MQTSSDPDIIELRAKTVATWKSLLGALCLSAVGLVALGILSQTNPGNSAVMIVTSAVIILPMWFLMISAAVTLNYVFRPNLVLSSELLRRFIIRRWIVE